MSDIRTARNWPHWSFYPALLATGVVFLLVLREIPFLSIRGDESRSFEPVPLPGGLLSLPSLALIAMAALAIWVVARSERSAVQRHEPLALVALSLVALGQLLIVQAGLAGARAGAPIPGLAVVTQAGIVLLLATLAGAVSLVRIERARPKRRGLVFALVGLVGAPCTLPMLRLLIPEPAAAWADAELELARSARALPYSTDPSTPEPVVDVLADGELRIASSRVASPASYGVADDPAQRERVEGALEVLVAAMPVHHHGPDGSVLLRVDAAAPYRHVRAALRAIEGAGVWNTRLLVVRAGHEIEGVLGLYLPTGELADAFPGDDDQRHARLAWVDGETRLTLGGEVLAADELIARARRAATTLLLVPDGELPWQAFITAFERLSPSRDLIGWPEGFLLTEQP